MSLNVKNLTKIFQSGEEQIIALDNISFDIPDHSFTSIVGASGSGKSTLLYLIAGLDTPTSGSVTIDNMRLDQMDENTVSIFRNQKIGFIFQQFLLLSDFTILENVMIPHYILSGNKRQSEQKAKSLLEKLNLKKKSSMYPHQISGGEAQRVAIARALINHPTLILADEPTGSLDEKNQTRVLDILLEMKQENPFTLLMVTHNMEFAKKTDHHIILEFGKLK